MDCLMYEYELDGLRFTVKIFQNDVGNFVAEFTVLEGHMDVNALWFSDGDDVTEGDITLVKRDSQLNMNGSESDGITWDDYTKLSSAGLGTEGEDKETFIQEGQTVSFDIGGIPEGTTLDYFSILGVRATSTSTEEGSIKVVDDGEPCPDGDPGFYIPFDLSNIVLYMGNEVDIIKVKINTLTLMTLDLNSDSLVSSNEINDFISGLDDLGLLDGHTELVAISVHNGNFSGATPFNTGYEPFTPNNQDNGEILHSGEGQLVLMDGEGFEVSGIKPGNIDDQASIDWLQALQDDVQFTSDPDGPYGTDDDHYESLVLAGTLITQEVFDDGYEISFP